MRRDRPRPRPRRRSAPARVPRRTAGSPPRVSPAGTVPSRMSSLISLSAAWPLGRPTAPMPAVHLERIRHDLGRPVGPDSRPQRRPARRRSGLRSRVGAIVASSRAVRVQSMRHGPIVLVARGRRGRDRPCSARRDRTRRGRPRGPRTGGRGIASSTRRAVAPLSAVARCCSSSSRDQVRMAEATEPLQDLGLGEPGIRVVDDRTAGRPPSRAGRSSLRRNSGWVVRVAIVPTTCRLIGRFTLTMPFS